MRRPSRTTAWSSTISTRIGAQPRGDLQPHGRPRARRASRSSSAPPSARARAPPSRSARAGARAAPASAGSKPTPSSATSSTSRPSPSPRAARAMRSRRGVAQRVLQRLLGDPQHLAVAAGAGSRGAPSTLELDRPRRGRGRSTLDVLAQRAARARRARASGGRSSKTASAAPRAPRARAPAARSSCARAARGVALEQRRRRLGGQHDAEQLLADDVVQLAREPVALLERSTARGCARTGARSSIAIAACAASSSISSWSSSANASAPLLVGEVEGADHAARARRSARRGTSACPGARAATSRGSAGRAWMSSVRYGVGRLEHRAEHAVRARQRARASPRSARRSSRR